MRLITVVTVIAASLAAASPHKRRHQHHQHHQRAAAPVAQPDDPSATVIVYELNGKQISQSDVDQGIKNGTLVFANGGLQSNSESAPPSTPAPWQYRSAPSTSVSVQAVSTSTPSPSDDPSPAPAPAPAPVPAPAPAAPQPQPEQHSGSSQQPQAQSYGSPSGSSGSFSPSVNGLETDFPSGTIDCSSFPSDYGAMHLDWLNLGGWTGIQKPGSTSGGYSNIETVPGGSASNGDYCCEGCFCSYACPPGFQKSQWPTTQGATGQSIGGIQCINGKLHLTNQQMSNKLCMTGAQEVPVYVQNKMDKNSAVCRTDYPGTEGETVPLDSQPGTTQNLTCPAADNYYDWQGAHTSAQYYVNPAGVSVQQACQWGSSANPWGNYAPLNLGVGYSGGSAWLSIFQNKPTTNQKLDFCVEIFGDNDGYDNLVGRCKYSNGQYCSDKGCSSDGSGCTVSVAHGTATFIFS